jgi:hypothetical protein
MMEIIRLHNIEVHNFYSSPDIMLIKSKAIWTDRVCNTHGKIVQKPEGTRQSRTEMTTIKWILREQSVRVKTALSWTRYDDMAGFCERSSEFSF